MLNEKKKYLLKDFFSDWEKERFKNRVTLLFFARLAFLLLNSFILATPMLREQFAIDFTIGSFWIVFMVIYTLVNYFYVDRVSDVGLFTITYITLCLDLSFLINLIYGTGAVRSPLLAAHLMITVFFGLLFPRIWLLLPSLLSLPAMFFLDFTMLQSNFRPLNFFLLSWYSAICYIVVYIIIKLDALEKSQQKSIIMLQEELRDKAVVEERTKLAREMHDGLGGSLSSLIIQSEYINALDDLTEVKEELKELRVTATESMDELRRSLAFLKDDFDVVLAIQDMATSFKSRSKIDTEVQKNGKQIAVSPEIQLCAFRICQESLNNIQKHSQAEKVLIKIDFIENNFVLEIEDNGVGFETEKGGKKFHYGLSNMAERAVACSGTLKIFSQPGVGTRVLMDLPIRSI